MLVELTRQVSSIRGIKHITFIGGNALKRLLNWSYFWVLFVGILIGYFGIPMLTRLYFLVFN